LVVRLDTLASGGFTDIDSWEVFGLTAVDAGLGTCFGAAFDGRFVYLPPYADITDNYGATVARFDTTGSFTSASSWSAYATGVDGSAGPFEGSAFDGRYVYFAPMGTRNEVFVRYDTQGDFASDTSWSRVDLASLPGGSAGTRRIGTVFDGRYIYVGPDSNGIVQRFDAKQPRSLPSIDGGSFL
jgi:hypothetical protein